MTMNKHPIKRYSAFGLYKAIRTHLLTQNEQSMRVYPDSNGKAYDCDNDEEEPVCVYHNKNGLKCAIGGLVSDHHYRNYIRTFDGVQSGTSVKHIADSELGFNASEHEVLCCAMQVIHDNVDPKYWQALNRLTWYNIVQAATHAARANRGVDAAVINLVKNTHAAHYERDAINA